MTVQDKLNRRQAWTAFFSSAVSNYQLLGDPEEYKDADDVIDETVENCAALADAALVEYLIRDKKGFELSDEEEEEIEDPDEEPEEEEEEEEPEEEEEDDDPDERRPAKKRAKRRSKR
jgi:hypothetical protein